MVNPGNDKRSSRHTLVDISRREVGGLVPRNFAHRFLASERMILEFGLDKKLMEHSSSVTTLSFNKDGSLLLSGSNDGTVSLWNWERQEVKLRFNFSHSCCILHALFLPCTTDRKIVTCSADGEVRIIEIIEGGGTFSDSLATHNAPAIKLATEPGSPYTFYSAGKDGVIRHYDLRARPISTKLICCRCFEYGQTVSRNNLTSIALDPGNPNLISTAGFSDGLVRVYDIRRCKANESSCLNFPVSYFCPSHMIGSSSENGITELAFSETSELLASYARENTYLFTPDLGMALEHLHPSVPAPNSDDESHSNENPLPRVFKAHCPKDTLVSRLSFLGPNCEYVVSGSNCGHVCIWKKKDAKLLKTLQGDRSFVICVQSHPYDIVMASSGVSEDFIKIWTPEAPVGFPHIMRESSNIPEDHGDEEEEEEEDNNDNDDDNYDDEDDYEEYYYDDTGNDTTEEGEVCIEEGDADDDFDINMYINDNDGVCDDDGDEEDDDNDHAIDSNNNDKDENNDKIDD